MKKTILNPKEQVKLCSSTLIDPIAFEDEQKRIEFYNCERADSTDRTSGFNFTKSMGENETEGWANALIEPMQFYDSPQSVQDAIDREGGYYYDDLESNARMADFDTQHPEFIDRLKEKSTYISKESAKFVEVDSGINDISGSAVPLVPAESIAQTSSCDSPSFIKAAAQTLIASTGIMTQKSYDVKVMEVGRGVTPYQVAQQILSEKRIIVYKENLYVYNGKYYERKSQTEIIRTGFDIRRETVEKLGNTSIIEQATKIIFHDPRLVIPEESLPRNLITFENGILNIASRTFLQHSPEFITFYKIRGRYCGGLDNTPNFDAFLYNITGGDRILIERIWRIIGYILSPDTNAKSFFLFQGVPNSGKSVLVSVIQQLFEDEAVQPLDAHAFSQKFSVATLADKALCISADMPSGPLDSKSVSIIKQMTGKDTISADVKFKNRIKFQCAAKILLVSNHALLTKENDDAFYDRAIVVPFLFSVPKEEQTVDLIGRLLNERDGIVTKAVHAYFRLVQENYIFPGYYPVNDVVMQSSNANSIVTLISDFIDNNIVLDADSKCFVRDIYEAFCANGCSISFEVFSQYFSKAMKDHFPNIEKKRAYKEGSKNATWYFGGVALKDSMYAI